jgi:hypothetical protein
MGKYRANRHGISQPLLLLSIVTCRQHLLLPALHNPTASVKAIDFKRYSVMTKKYYLDIPFQSQFILEAQ